MKRSEREAIVDGLTQIDTVIEELDLPPYVKERATEIYRETVQEGSILPGRGIENTAGTCVLLATRESDSIKEAEDVADAQSYNIHAKSLHRTSKDIRKKLDIGFMLADPHKYVDEIGKKLDATNSEIQTAHSFVDELRQKGVSSGQKAATIAARIFYVISIFTPENGTQGKYTQSEIANAADISTVSIRNHYREYIDELDDPRKTISSGKEA